MFGEFAIDVGEIARLARHVGLECRADAVGNRLPHRTRADVGDAVDRLVQHAMGERAKLAPVLRIERSLRDGALRVADDLVHAALSSPCSRVPRQHRRERGKDLAHLRRLVRKHDRRIHVVHDGGVVGFEDQQLAVLVLGAIDDEIIEADAPAHLVERDLVARARTRWSKSSMKTASSSPLLLAERHVGVEIPDVPAIGDRHVAGVGLAVDHGETIFAIEPVGARIVDEARDEEILLLRARRDRPRAPRASSSFASPTPACVPRGRAIIGKRSSPAMSSQAIRPCDEIRQLRARRVDGRGNVETRDARQQPIQLVAIEIADEIADD